LRPSFLRFTTPKVGALDYFPRDSLLAETEPYHLIEIHLANMTHLMMKTTRLYTYNQ